MQKRRRPLATADAAGNSRQNVQRVVSKKLAGSSNIAPSINISIYTAVTLAQVAAVSGYFFYFSPSILEDPLSSIQNTCVILAVTQLVRLHMSGFIPQERIRITILAIIHVVASTLTVHFMAIMYGAPLTKQIYHTFLFALFLSILVVPTVSASLKINSATWIRLFCEQKPQSFLEHLIYWPALLGVLGAWLGAVPIPLDWDRPWQAWPITCVLGALAGHTLGAIIGIAMSFQK